MDLVLNDHAFKCIRQEVVSFLGDLELKYFVTLNFRDIRDKGDANIILGMFIKRLNVSLFGRRSKKAIRCVPSIERHKTGFCHIHILFEDPEGRVPKNAGKRLSEDDFKELIRMEWERVDSKTASIRKSCPDGVSWFKNICDKEGALSYVSKQIRLIEQDAIQWDVLNKTGRRHDF